MPSEVASQVRLIVEPDRDRHVRDRFAVEQSLPGDLDAARDHILMWRDSERSRKPVHHPRRRRPDRGRCFSEGERLEQVGLQEVPQCARKGSLFERCTIDPRITEVHPELLGHDSHHRFRFERIVAQDERSVETSEGAEKGSIVDVGPIGGSTDQVSTQHPGIDVEHPFAEPGLGRGPAVVHDVWREHGDERRSHATGTRFEVVADRPVIDDEDGPVAVRVLGVDVVHEPRVEHLRDAGDRRLPGSDPLTFRWRWHVKNVQDGEGPSVVRSIRG